KTRDDPLRIADGKWYARKAERMSVKASPHPVEGGGNSVMIDKRVGDVTAAVAGITDGATVMVGGFGSVGQPDALVEALIEQGARSLTLIANNAGAGRVGVAKLLEARRVRKIIC